MCGFSFVDGMSDIDEWENDAENKNLQERIVFQFFLLLLLIISN